MTQPVEVQRFAAFLRMLKDRTDRSYGALAQRAGVSSSSLHRYCTGTKVPPGFGPVQRFARACGASPEEVRELHRLWALADASRVPAAPAEPEAGRPADTVAGRDAAEAGGDALEAGGDRVEPVDVPETPGPGAPRAGLPRPVLLTGVTVVVLVLAVGAWAVTIGRNEPARAGGDGAGRHADRLLFSAACPETVSMGQHDECVREVQTLLSGAGAVLSVDSDFGPETLRRVTAFQVLAGLQPRGVVDDATKSALYEGDVRVATWPAGRVERRIREVFPEEPDRAVGIARCQSFLDPLHVLPNTNGTRNWGLFQISDTSLRRLGGSPRLAFDPEWNIQAARRLWADHRDFSHWPHCDQAFRASPSNRSPAGGR